MASTHYVAERPEDERNPKISILKEEKKKDL
jgi:hypothetical protein